MSAMHALLLPLGRDLYALPLDWAREVVSAPDATRLVTAPDVVMGLFNLRGQIVPLLDTARLLGRGAVDSAAYAVVVESPKGLAGLATTGFPERRALEESVGSSELAGTAGLYRVADRVAALLDPGVLLTGEPASAPGSWGDAAVGAS